MPDHTDNGFRAAIKALSDVVGPAVDPSNPLAVEQLRLVIQFLEFFALRRRALPVIERAELRLHAELAGSLAATLDGVDPSLSAEIGRAVEAARSPDLATFGDEIAVATSRLATLASEAVRAAGRSDLPGRRQLERTVVERSGDLLDLKRAWFLPFGFESAPDTVPSLQGLLDGKPRARRSASNDDPSINRGASGSTAR